MCGYLDELAEEEEPFDDSLEVEETRELLRNLDLVVKKHSFKTETV